MNTITVPRRKPRNPLVAAARFRRAGSHRAQRGTQRQEGGRALRAELKHLKDSP